MSSVLLTLTAATFTHGSSCESDCTDGWCRDAKGNATVDCLSDKRECVPYREEGEYCGGGYLSCYEEACREDLRCVPTPGFIVISTCIRPCVSDANCASDQWCRNITNTDWSCSNDAKCVPRGIEGDFCGESVSDCFEEKCQTGLECVYTSNGGGTCTVPRSCEADADCSADQWCRQLKNADDTCSTDKACVPLVAEGGSCDSFTSTCFQEVCQVGLECATPSGIVDGPGTCNAPPSCESNADCEVDQWCREVNNTDDSCSTDKTCVPRIAEGGSCDSSALSCFQEVCQVGLECAPAGTLDAPGTCTPSCESDAGCSPDKWCRYALTVNGTCSEDRQVCVSRVGEGETCSEVVPACNSERCQVGLSCVFADTDADAGTCVAGCVSDSDCGVQEWCREAKSANSTCSNDLRECVPRAEEGASCGGLLCDQEICQTGMDCVVPDGSANGSGTCTVPVPPSCESDDDCGSDKWCRMAKADGSCLSDTRECVPFLEDGEHCTNVIVLCYGKRCKTGSSCVVYGGFNPLQIGKCTAA